MYDWKAYGHRQRAMRAALGVSEQEFAKDVGVSIRTVRRWEAGFKGRRFPNVVEFARKHDISIDWLVLGEGSRLPMHVTRKAAGKVALLPMKGPRQREIDAERARA